MKNTEFLRQILKFERQRGAFVTGSVARNEDTQSSDIDLLIISATEHSFEEKEIEGRLVEIKTNTLEGFKQKMRDEPMNVYQWLDAKAVNDPENLLTELQKYSEDILNNYTPPTLPKKWLESSLTKIESAKQSKNNLLLGFNVSNVLWKIVEGFYIFNFLPTPPSTTAFRRINTLKKLPDNFDKLWKDVLTGDLDIRAEGTKKLIEYLLK
jgi:predicted nucleotidyltransferase